MLSKVRVQAKWTAKHKWFFQLQITENTLTKLHILKDSGDQEVWSGPLLKCALPWAAVFRQEARWQQCLWYVCVWTLSHAQRFATPWTVAHQAPLSMRFSRQEPWSGLPFPPPMHESEKWKWSCLVVSNSLRPHGLQPTRLLHPWDFPGKSTGVGCHCLLHPCCIYYLKYLSPIFAMNLEFRLLLPSL